MIGVKKVRFPYPHPGQQAVQRQAKRFNWLSAGRRWRKTTLGMVLAAEGCLRGELWLWGAPTYKQMMIGWSELEKAVGDVATFKKGDQEVQFPTGGRLICRSLDDPDNARGYTADGVVLDEVGDVKEEAYYQIVRPMLIDTGGILWAIGTPKGRNWFWREHRNASERADSVAWQIPTRGCDITDDGGLLQVKHPYENPEVPWEEIVNMFNTTPNDIFEQEIMARFMKYGGTVFRNIIPNLYEPNGDLHEGHMKIMTIDWGQANDFTVIDVGCGDCKVELEFDRFNKIDYAFQRDRIKTMYDKWQPEVVVGETNAMGKPNVEALWDDGVPVTGWRMDYSNKGPLIRGLAAALDRQTWKWIDDKQATFELEAYEQKVNPKTNLSQFSAPSGAHDDIVITRALLVHAEANMGHVPITFT
jgi:hypothetical protein